MTGVDEGSFAFRRLAELLEECERLEDVYYTGFGTRPERRALREKIDKLHQHIAGAANVIAAEAAKAKGRSP